MKEKMVEKVMKMYYLIHVLCRLQQPKIENALVEEVNVL